MIGTTINARMMKNDAQFHMTLRLSGSSSTSVVLRLFSSKRKTFFLALMINKHFSLLFVKAFLAAAFYYAERKKLKNGLKPRLSFK